MTKAATSGVPSPDGRGGKSWTNKGWTAAYIVPLRTGCPKVHVMFRAGRSHLVQYSLVLPSVPALLPLGPTTSFAISACSRLLYLACTAVDCYLRGNAARCTLARPFTPRSCHYPRKPALLNTTPANATLAAIAVVCLLPIQFLTDKTGRSQARTLGTKVRSVPHSREAPDLMFRSQPRATSTTQVRGPLACPKDAGSGAQRLVEGTPDVLEPKLRYIRAHIVFTHRLYRGCGSRK